MNLRECWKAYYTNGIYKKASIAFQVSDKVEFKAMGTYIKGAFNKEKRSIYQNGIITLYLYAPKDIKEK